MDLDVAVDVGTHLARQVRNGFQASIFSQALSGLRCYRAARQFLLRRKNLAGRMTGFLSPRSSEIEKVTVTCIEQESDHTTGQNRRTLRAGAGTAGMHKGNARGPESPPIRLAQEK
jgi:hypothetical protein